MFRENFKSPLHTDKRKEKNYHSIGKIKAKRIILPPLQVENKDYKLTKSLFSKQNSLKQNRKSKENREDIFKNFFSPQNNNKLILKEKRYSRIGIENTYSIKTKNKSILINSIYNIFFENKPIFPIFKNNISEMNRPIVFKKNFFYKPIYF